MTRIKKTASATRTARFFASDQLSVGFIVALAIAAFVDQDPSIARRASVAAFGTATLSRPHASTKFNPRVPNQRRHFHHRLRTPPLFVEKRSGFAENTGTLSREQRTNPKETQAKHGAADLHRSFAGVALALAIATTSLGGFPLPANAGFGPSSGATTTPPPNLNSITTTAAKTTPENAPSTEFNVDLDGKKLKILIDSALNVRRLEEFSGQLDALIDNLRDSMAALTLPGDETETNNNVETSRYYDADNPYIEYQREVARLRNAEREIELEKAQNLQLEVQKQQKMLIKLQNQPYWFNYFAAFVGSTVSTLIMHPIDTIKTRLQVGLGDDDDEENDGGEDWNAHGFETNPRDLNNTNEIPFHAGNPESSSFGVHHNDPTKVGGVATVASATTTATVVPLAAEAVSTTAVTTNSVVTVGNENETSATSKTSEAAPTASPLVSSAPSVSTTATSAAIAISGEGAATTNMRKKASSSAAVFDDLYEGLTGNLFKEVPPSAVYLGVYETVKYALAPKVAPAYLLCVYLVAGAAGETVGSFIRAPAEAVKSLVQSKAKDNALDAAKSVLGTHDGRVNVLRAWSASIGRDVPFGAIQLAAFETIKAAILNSPNIEIDSSTLLSEAVIGAFAGGLGAFVTNPADVITTRIITQDPTGGSSGGDGGSGEENNENAPLGVIGMGKKIYDEDGFGAFFAGWEARVGYWAPAISIFLTCYCSVRQAGISYDLFP